MRAAAVATNKPFWHDHDAAPFWGGVFCGWHFPQNRRIIKISLTEEAKAFVEQIKSEMHEDLMEKLSAFSDSEFRELVSATNIIADKLSKLSE